MAIREQEAPGSDADSTSSPAATHTLALVALLAAVVQAVTVVVLGNAKMEAVQQAAAEGSFAYVLGTLIVVACLWGVYALRDRPAVALPLLLATPLLVWLPLRTRLSALGLAYHGEYIAYHFVALLSAVLCEWIPRRWATDPVRAARLGPLRWVPFGLSVITSVTLMLAHLSAIPGFRFAQAPALAAAGAVTALLLWGTCVAVAFRRPAGAAATVPTSRAGSIALALLLLPVLTRVLATGEGGPAAGLRGAPVDAGGVMLVAVAIVVVAALVAALLRPKMELWLHGLIAFVCMVAVAMAGAAYTYMFGVLEDGLDGVARSFLGFSVPYPAYVPTWQVVGFMLGMFFILLTVYTTLVSTRDRTRGVALAMLTVAGIGLSSPHLVLLMTAGVLVFADDLLFPPADPEPDDAHGDAAGEGDGNQQGARDLTAVVEHVARRLDAAEPVTVDSLSMLRDEVEGVAFDLRARDGRKPELTLTVGLAGRTSPDYELVPDKGQGGHRPAHLLARTHRVVGDARALERLGDRPLDALTRLPHARVRAWEAGWEVELKGKQAVADADADAIEGVLRAVARTLSV